MSHVNVTIGLIGIHEDVILDWKLVPTEPRYTYAFYMVKDLDEIQLAGQPLVILNQTMIDEYPLPVIREKIGSVGKLVLWDNDYASLSEADMRLLDACWPATKNSALNRITFERFVRRLREEKDAWLEHIWLQKTINMLPDMIWFKDRQGLYLEVNDAFCARVNKTKETVRGQDHYTIWGISREEYESSDYVCVDTDAEVIKAGKTCIFDEEVMGADGLRKLKTYKTPIFEEDGQIIGTIGIARDVTEAGEYERTLHDLAYRDYLTSLFNRAYLLKKMDEYGSGPVLMIVFDLDYFKELNDHYGHQSGDAALMVVGELMQQEFPDGFNIRYGGDEFLTVFFGASDKNVILPRVERFMHRLKNYFSSDKDLGCLTVSAGMHCQTITDGAIDLLFSACDKALYAAKLHGRNRVVQYEDIDQVMSKPAIIQFESREATEKMLQREIGVLGHLRVARTGVAEAVSAMLVFAADLPEIETKYGKALVHQVIAGVVNIINASIRDSDKLGRWSEETFLVVFPATDVNAAVRVAERIRHHIKDLDILPDGQPLSVNCSIAAIRPNEDYKAFSQRLEDALTKARQAGKNLLHVEDVSSPK